MRVLANIRPTAEQLPIINDYRAGPMIVRGAAGSGKTTTAVLRLRHVVNVWRSAAQRDGRPPVRVLVLTFNRTLRGYVEELVHDQVRADHVDLTLATFSRWALPLAGGPAIATNAERQREIIRLGAGLGLHDEFLVDEVDYVTGRFPGENLDGYLDQSDREIYKRHGRGGSPQMPVERRRRLVEDVLRPYASGRPRHESRTGTTLPYAPSTAIVSLTTS